METELNNNDTLPLQTNDTNHKPDFSQKQCEYINFIENVESFIFNEINCKLGRMVPQTLDFNKIYSKKPSSLYILDEFENIIKKENFYKDSETAEKDKYLSLSIIYDQIKTNTYPITLLMGVTFNVLNTFDNLDDVIYQEQQSKVYKEFVYKSKVQQIKEYLNNTLTSHFDNKNIYFDNNKDLILNKSYSLFNTISDFINNNHECNEEFNILKVIYPNVDYNNELNKYNDYVIKNCAIDTDNVINDNKFLDCDNTL